MIRSIVCAMVIVLLGCGMVASNESDKEEPPKVGEPAPDFTLQDADDKAHALKQLRGKVVFLIMGNRKIRKEDDKWAEAFQKDYRGNEAVKAYIVADMRSVPGFVPKGFIKNQLNKNKPPVTLLLDWKGQVHQAYQTVKEKPSLYLIHPEGQIAFHMKADFDKSTYQKIKALTDEILESTPSN